MEFLLISVIFAVSFLCIYLAGRNAVDDSTIAALILFFAAGALFTLGGQILLANTITSILTRLG